MPGHYHNRYPQQYEAELRAARQAGVVPTAVPGTQFDGLAAEGERMIYVVVDGQLRVSKRRARGEHISHAVLAGGDLVHAAGEFEVIDRDGAWEVIALNNMSGHYRPAPDTLEIARAAFESAGLPVRPDGIQHYDLGTP